jgi:multidrug transporter EmrE-like cation transporter
MIPELIPLGWVILAALVEAPALTLLRVGGVHNMIGAGAIFAFCVVPLLTKALQYEGIGLVNFFWNILSTTLMFTIGIFFFKEKVANLQIVGVILSLVGLGLIVLSK